MVSVVYEERERRRGRSRGISPERRSVQAAEDD